MEPDVVANGTANEGDQQLPGSQTKDHSVWHPHMSWNFLRLHDDLLFLQNRCSKKAIIDRVLLR